MGDDTRDGAGSTSPVTGDHDPPRDRRTELLRAAYRVMAREGVHRTPLNQVAEEAGVSKGLLLYHFRSKDALVLAAMEWVLNATSARIQKALAAINDPAEAIGAVVDAVWVGAEPNRDFFRFYLDGVEHETRSPGFEALGSTMRSIINGLYQDVIEAGVEAGFLDVDDPETAASNMRALIEGTFLQWLQTEDWRKSHARYREQCRTALMGLLGAGAGARRRSATRLP